jgi:Zn-dependent protease with chaperone function
MTYIALALCCALLSYGALNAAVSLGVAAFWRFTPRWVKRPNSILLLRMLPAATSSLFVAFFFLPGFFQLEPRDTTETVSPLMVVAASIPILLFVWGVLHGLLSWLATERLVRRWVSRGERRHLPGTSSTVYCIDSDFPVISLAGVLRPRLFVSSQVLTSCTPKEFAAVLAHETSHRKSRDNLKRLLMRLCPDFLALTPTAKSIERTWSESSDMAADESAAGTDPGVRTDLATAIVKVARLAAGRRFLPEVLASAFHRGEGIGRRVRSLVGEPAATPSPHYGWVWTVVGILVLSSALEPKVLEHVHRVTEAVVHILQ